MRPIRTLVQLAALLSGVAGSALLLLRMRGSSWLPPPNRILTAVPEEAIYGAVWLVATAITAWVGITTVLSVTAYITRIPVAVRATRWMTIAPIRRLSRRAAALVLAVGSLSISAPAGAAYAPPVPYVVTAEHPGSTIDTAGGAILPDPSMGATVPIPTVTGNPDQDSLLVSPPDTGGVVVPVPHLAGDPLDVVGGRGEASVTYTVQRGDHLWSITAGYLAAHLGRTVSAEEVAPLWNQVIEINRNLIGSGDPNLIFPGERIILPDLGARAGTLRRP
jgi:nucleoid-associated protein YgaU